MNESPLEMWKNLNLFLFTQGQSVEKYDIRGSCLWRDFDLDLGQVGYRNGGLAKYKRWHDLYISSEEVLKFNGMVQIIIEKKKDFVACFRFGSKPKKSPNKVGDFCLIAAAYIFKSGKLKKINIYYRSTEATTKFLADLILLKGLFKHHLNFVDYEGARVEFFFTKVYTRYFHVLTFCSICKWEFDLDVKPLIGDWVTKLVNNVVKGRRKFKFQSAKRVARRFLEDNEYENVGS